MLVGIMSMQRIDNYGSFLQALGLKMMIEQLGHKVVFIDFKVGATPSSKRWKNSRLMRRIKLLIYPPPLDLVCRETPFFREEYGVLGIDEKRQYHTKVDVLVIGSDEVFNCIQMNPQVGFSLELLGANNNAHKVISYAASCGNLTLDKIEKFGRKKEISKHLNRINNLSVRDANTEQVVKALTGSLPELNLDPVLLNDYGKLFRDNVNIHDYILVYGYSHRFTEEEGSAIALFAKKRKKKLVSFCGPQEFCDSYIACSPLEIVSYFKHADCIITDTFHGSIFSAICHKPFITIYRSDASVGYGNQEKVIDLLHRLKLEKRIVKDIQNIEQDMWQSIDYDQVDKIRKKEREKAMSYLEKNIAL